MPLEDGHPDRQAVAAEFPEAVVPDVPLPAGLVDEHDRYDRRRSAGIAASAGSIVAIIEDRGTPAPDWATRVVEAHARRPGAVIGGVVSNGVDLAWNDAVWLCDFGRYAPPQDEGPRATLTDVNVSYPRDLLLAVQDAWTPRYHEPVVHEALARSGAPLWLDPNAMVIQERPPIGAFAALGERLAWGRLFGRLRARSLRLPARLAYGVGSLLLPPVLFARAVRNARGRLPAWRLLRATPWLVLLLVTWCLGEAAGTASGNYNPLPTKKMR